MHTQSEGRGNAVMVVVLVMFMLTAWMVITDRSEVASAPEPPVIQSSDLLSTELLPDNGAGIGGNILAKYEGVVGESDNADHPGWTNVLTMEWGVGSDSGTAVGPTRRRGAPIISDLVLKFNYDKAVPKLAEKLLKGEVIPKLEIEFLSGFGDADVTYLRYELTNVALTNYEIVGMADHGPPTVAVANNFEKIKVTYTEYDDQGSPAGTVEYEYKVEKG